MISTTDKTWGGDGFLINTPDNGFKTVRIKNLIIQRTIRPTPDFAGGFGIAFANCNDVIVKGCTISNSGHTAIHAEKGYNYTIESNNIYTSVKGLNIEQLRLAKVLNNNVFGCVDGFSTYNVNVNSIDWDVSGNYFDGCTGYPAIVSSSDRGKFNNNTFINSTTTSAILSIQTTNGRPCSNSEFKNNKFILGTGSGTVALFLSTESIGNIFEGTQYTGYVSTSFLQNITTNRARVESYIGEGNKKGAMIWSDKDPNGYYNGRAGDLCTDTVLGIFYKCVGGLVWKSILPSAYGATAQRPTSPLTGELYFDTNLESPIWLNGTQWVLAVPNATSSRRGLVLQSTSIANITIPDATDEISAIALTNINKLKINEILAKLRTAGVVVT